VLPPRITRLFLHHFRNHRACDIVTDAPLIILAGANGAGKTNILEAVSLLSPGRGFRSALPSQQRQRDGETEWVVRAEVTSSNTAVTIATGSTATEKRLIKINGEVAPRQQDLLEILDVLWFLPTMSHLFQESGSAQRNYLDRMVYGFDREHASRLHAYAHYVRERRKLLSAPSPQTAWLESIERSIAEYSVAIAYARNDTIARLTQAMGQVDAVFPHATLNAKGTAEDVLQYGMAALEVEAHVAELLAAARPQDRQRGRCSVGAHKTQLHVTFAQNAMPAAHCSTGEQKALLLSLLLAQMVAQHQWNGRLPIILLDEIVAHLDAQRRDALFSVLRDAGAQTWVTGTDVADFSATSSSKHALFLVENGQVAAKGI
jgi:DNA replication and repair protein RecF